jgi:uncharacterized membrane protein
MKGSLLGCFLLGLSCRYKRFSCPAFNALVGLVQKNFPSPYTISIHLSPSSSKLGRQSCRVAFLLRSVSGVHCALSLSFLYVIQNIRSQNNVQKLPERSFKKCLNSSTVLRQAELLFCTYSAIYFDTVETLIVKKPVLEFLKKK